MAKDIYLDSSICLAMRHIMLLALAMLLCSFAGLGQTNRTSLDELNASELQYLVIDSSARLESYCFSMEMVMNTDLVNLTSGDVQTLHTRTLGYGLANMTDTALKLSMAALTYAKGDMENTSVIALDEYLINDTIYMKVDGNWTAIKMPGMADALSQQRTMAQQTQYVQSVSPHTDRLGDGGRSGLLQGPGGDEYEHDGRSASGEVPSLVPMKSMNYSELFSNMSNDVCYWISKGGIRSPSQEDGCTGNIHIVPSVVWPAVNESMQMRIDSETIMLFEGFNESVNIKLPAEAKKAQPFPRGLIVSKPENNTAQAAATSA